MLVYRIARQKYASDLSGTGARLNGGRWNSTGVSMLYTASSRALAVLEMLVHTSEHFVPNDLEVVTLDIPDNVSINEIDIAKIAPDIKKVGIDARFNTIGDNWMKENTTLVLIVPSVIIPEEKNILLNPLHAEFKKVKLVDRKPFQFDERLTRQ